MSEIKYVHTNIVAKDWKKLAHFYEKALNCKPLLPTRDLSGKWLDKATSLNDAKITGIHLQLPGYKKNSPTLEIFQYAPEIDPYSSAINQRGFSHIAFQVENIEMVYSKIIENGGKALGKSVQTEVKGIGKLHFAYMHDPEGNIIEIQEWIK